MSDVEARREARRRRILENSEKRLQRITGIEKRNASYELEGFKSSQNIEDEENHVHNSLPNIGSSSNSHIPPEVETLYRNPLITSSFTRNSAVNNKINFTKTYRILIIVGIACITNLLILYGDTDTHINKIFIPLLCFEAIDVFYNYENNASINRIMSLLFIFCRNIPQNYLILIARYFQLGVTIMRDIMMFFFFFVCIGFFLKVLHGILYF